MTQELTTQQEAEAIAQRIAERAGENTRTYSLMPTITVYNPSKKNPDNQTPIGSLVKSIKTEQGYSNEIFPKPLKGVIIKTRMFLKLKFKYGEGKPNLVTNEFNSYTDDEIIIVKQQDADGKYQPVFEGNYNEVHDKYSLKGDTEIERKLDLHHAIYVLDMDTEEVVRLDSKGLSRSNYFEYMNSFSRKGLDKMSSTFTLVDSEISKTDFKGQPRQAPVAAFTFQKAEQLTTEQLIRLEKIQLEFQKQLLEKDKAFGNIKVVTEGIDTPVKEELPTIQLEEVEKPAELPLEENEEGGVRIEDVPF